jgi:hypothetical protein
VPLVSGRMRKQRKKWASAKSVMMKVVEKSLNKELMREKVVKLWKRKL